MPKLEPIDPEEIPQANPVEDRFRRKPNPDRVPEWAKALTQKVCKDYSVEPPVIRWRQSKRYWNSGSHKFERRSKLNWISLTVGITQPGEQSCVLIHELAHYIRYELNGGDKEGHSYRFWKLNFELVMAYLPQSLWPHAYEMAVEYKVRAQYAVPREIREAYESSSG